MNFEILRKEILCLLKYYYWEYDTVYQIMEDIQYIQYMVDGEIFRLHDFDFTIKCHIVINGYDEEIRIYSMF